MERDQYAGNVGNKGNDNSSKSIGGQQGSSASEDSKAFLLKSPTINLPKSGGAIRGIGEKFNASNATGTGSMNVPIATSAGRSGFDPELMLTYDSGAGNGPFGFGWNISLASITRKTDKGLPRYDDVNEPDIFILSGSEDLVPVLLPDGSVFKDETAFSNYLIHRFRPRTEGLFARIERWTNKTTKEIHWRSISKDNITTVYGKNNNSRIANPADLISGNALRIFSWLICESYDDKGNAIIYEYAEDNDVNIDHSKANEKNRVRTANRYLKRIKYGNRIPNRDQHSWQPTDPSGLPEDNWMFEVVFDYEEGHYSESTPDQDGRVFAAAASHPVEGNDWPVRKDPFSTYRSGFEVRTCRLCRRVLMFHHFPDELGIADCLTQSTSFSYVEQGIGSFISSITQSGYTRQPTDLHPNRYFKKSLPPLAFQYSEIPDAQTLAGKPILETGSESLKNLPVGLSDNYQWIDLDGEGLSGIFTEQAEGWFYKRNVSANHFSNESEGSQQTSVCFGSLELVADKPLCGLADGGHFADLAGDGQIDVVQTEGSMRGFYERTDDGGWLTFQPFISCPNVPIQRPDLRFIDLTGDGNADILITEGDTITWYPSIGEEGYGNAVNINLPSDDEKGPRLVFTNTTIAVLLADMSGDGLTDLVRIQNGETCYWPNLGYGRFGAKVAMDNAPWFDKPDLFDPRRLKLTDTDGSGTTDIIYLNKHGADIYFNQSGNAFSAAVTLTQFPSIDNTSSVDAIDLLGNGTACLVWSSALPGNTGKAMRYIQLMNEKPHLLTVVRNNLGAETKVHYAPSTKFYLNDKQDGKPWITRLPFPVNVVERIETYDYISRNRFITRYAYHHGYFDGREREFRGFGTVEQWDTTDLSIIHGNGAAVQDTNWDATSFTPPVLTRTWFHTGAFNEKEPVSLRYRQQYYHEGDVVHDEAALTNEQWQAMLLPDTVLPLTQFLADGTRTPISLSAEEVLQAFRSLKGLMLRQEIYGLDDSDASERPYSVSQRNYSIELLQPKAGNQHAVFFAHARESVDFQYDQKLFNVGNEWHADPRVTHNMTLDVDSYGNVLKSALISYGRRYKDESLITEDQEKQTTTLVTYTRSLYTKPVEDVSDYRNPLKYDVQTYELINFGIPVSQLPDITNLFKWEHIAAQIAKAEDGDHNLPYEDVNHKLATPNEPCRRLIEHLHTLFRRNDLTGFSPPGTNEALALKGEDYQLAFTGGLIQSVYIDRGKLNIAEIENTFGTSAGYIKMDGQWWVPSGRVFYSPTQNDTAPSELVFARAHFFLPHRFEDPFGNDVIVLYDSNEIVPSRNHNLFVIETTDAVGNKTTCKTMDDAGQAAIRIDYRVLKPYWVTDPNLNRTQVAFDALGLVVATAVMGKPGENKGDNLSGIETGLTRSQLNSFIEAPDPNQFALAHLSNATTRLIYDIDAFFISQQQHPDNIAAWQPAFTVTLARETHFNDPLPADGLKLDISYTYSDGFNREIQTKIQAEPGPVPQRDANGKIIIGADNLPVMTTVNTSPRWSGSGWTIFNNKGNPVRQYEPFFTDVHRFEFDVRIGISSLLLYDPLQRVIATIHPNHSWEKVIFNPWQQVTYDVNDTVGLHPATDKALKGYLINADLSERIDSSVYLPTWSQLRTDPQHADLLTALYPDVTDRLMEKDAAVKAEGHAETPVTIFLDTLGRTFLTTTHNKITCTGHPADGAEEKIHTRIKLDIEGNQREVRDAIIQQGDVLGRIVMQYDYDMLGNRIHQISMEAGERWLLNDITGKVVLAWNSRNHSFRTEYDRLRRPLRSFVKGVDPQDHQKELLVERFVYGEQHPEDLLRNLRTRIFLHLDQAGATTTEFNDFKGNPLHATRRLTNGIQYRQTMNWSAADRDSAAFPDNAFSKLDLVALENTLSQNLETDIFKSNTEYDAQNRPVTLTTPHTQSITPSIIRPVYNEANLLEQLTVNINGVMEAGQRVWTSFVSNIDYDAKGQRKSITYGNGVTTTYTYDPLTFRLTHLVTKRSVLDFPGDCPQPPPDGWQGCQLQNLHYSYDAAGNITHIRDNAQQTIFFRNKRVEPRADFTYDALYQLIQATGREHLGQVGGSPVIHSHNDAGRTGLLSGDGAGRFAPNDGNAMGNYTERYLYDAVGNFLEMQHRGTDPLSQGWTRTYSYDETSLIENGSAGTLQKKNNRLSSTTTGNDGIERYRYDAHGNMIRMPHLGGADPDANMEWNYLDQLSAADLGGGGKAYYVYDSSGQRIRKVWEKSPGLVEERIYLGSFELFRKHNGAGEVALQRETLHVMDDKQRIALVETRTVGNDPSPEQQVRFQFSNHLGSASLELDHQAQIISYEEYSPYGSSTYQAVSSQTDLPKRYRYTGKERDEESGCYYHGKRYYVAWIAKWISPDSAGIMDGVNLYLYVRGNPLSNKDSTGLQTENSAEDLFQFLRNDAAFAEGKANVQVIDETIARQNAFRFGMDAQKGIEKSITDARAAGVRGADRVYSEVAVDRVTGEVKKIGGSPIRGADNLDLVSMPKGSAPLQEGGTLSKGGAELVGDVKHGRGTITQAHASYGSRGGVTVSTEVRPRTAGYTPPPAGAPTPPVAPPAAAPTPVSPHTAVPPAGAAPAAKTGRVARAFAKGKDAARAAGRAIEEAAPTLSRVAKTGGRGAAKVLGVAGKIAGPLAIAESSYRLVTATNKLDRIQAGADTAAGVAAYAGPVGQAFSVGYGAGQLLDVGVEKLTGESISSRGARGMTAVDQAVSSVLPANPSLPEYKRENRVGWWLIDTFGL